MKINKEELKQLAEKNDSELWGEIQKIAGSHGYKLPESSPGHENLEKIRRALSGAEKMNLADAARIINSCKKNK